ncbi:MAG: hypothetical protein ACE5H4_12350 [Candidatus Thorarchaeota archaeon]
MRCVGVSSSVELFAQEDSYFSYFNSPYIGHKRCSAIDIYPSHGDWGGPAFSPIDGKVVATRKISMGTKKVFPSEGSDYAIATRPEGTDKIVRVLHCTPGVSRGDSVDRGDEIGRILRSRFFCFWTGPHYHVEVMDEKDFSRSSQSDPISVDLPSATVIDKGMQKKPECQVTGVSTDIMTGVFAEWSYVRAGNLFGHLALVDGASDVGILDGGVPHYNHGGFVGRALDVGGRNVDAWSSQVGVVTTAYHNFLQFDTSSTFRPKVDDIPIHGISCYIFSRSQTFKGMPPIYLIPEKYGQFVGEYNEGDVVMVSFG